MRFKEMREHTDKVGQKATSLEGMRSRYQALLGRTIPADIAAATVSHEEAKTAWSSQLRAMRVAVSVHAGATGHGATSPSDSKVTSAVMAHLSASKIPATEGSSSCPADTAFWLRVEVKLDSCKRPGMGVSCELSLVATLGRCGSSEALDSARLQGMATRGAAMDAKKAIEKAWGHLTAPENTEVRSLLEKLVGRHLPIDLLGANP